MGLTSPTGSPILFLLRLTGEVGINFNERKKKKNFPKFLFFSEKRKQVASNRTHIKVDFDFSS